MIKNGIEDYKRHQADAEVNARTVVRSKTRQEMQPLLNQWTAEHAARGSQPGAGQGQNRTLHSKSHMLRSITDKPAWKDIRVGDFLLVKEGDEIPADLLILASSEEGGKCFTETANLDGETNLKRKQALRATSEAIGQRETPKDDPIHPWIKLARATALRGEVQYELPNDRLYTFVGTMKLHAT